MLKLEAEYDPSIDPVMEEDQSVIQGRSWITRRRSGGWESQNPRSGVLEKLPADLWRVILWRLALIDYFRSGTVCRSWRRATAGNSHRRSAKSPWLMFPGAEEGSDDPNYFRFCNIGHLTPRRLRLPQIHGKWIDRSFRGSIIAFGPTDILFLDPLTAAEVRLPLVTRLNDNAEVEIPLIEKIIFSPSKSTAAAIYVDQDYERRYLSFARIGDTSWTGVCKSYFFHYFYFFDLIIHSAASLHHYDRMYLVNSLDGDYLLLVCRMMDYDSWITDSFKVFRQDRVGRRWVEMGSLGDVAIFVGSNYSTCIFTRGMPELRGNCVYFTEDLNLNQARDDFGVFSLEKGSIEQFVSLQHNNPSRPPPFWIMPSLS